MSASRYPLLFSPIEIGPVSLPNRVYHSPVTLNYVDRRKGSPTEDLAYYYAERAKGGIGLVIQGAVDVAPASEYWPVPNTRMDDPEVIPAARRIVERVHAHGTRIFAQLFHIGQASNTRLYGRPSVGPSAVPSLVAGTTPKRMEEEDITEAVERFARAARNAREAGYDGVELHASHGYLLEQFLSPFFNKRTDEYGGSLDNRMRLILEVVERCREAVGGGLALGVRLVGDELLPGGLVLEDAVEIAGRLAATDRLDFLDIDVGSHQNYHLTMGPMYVSPGYNVPLAAAVREVAEPLPVLCAPGRLADAGAAERVLADGHADLVGLGRSLIADPEWLRKVREGRDEDIRQCVYCNQYTMGNLYKGLPVRCIHNPAVGRERVWGGGTLRATPSRKQVIVVGGGPAGLEVARLARLRGHSVTLHERDGELGGRVRLAARLPRRQEIEGVVRWLRMQVEKSGVEVVLASEATAEHLVDLDPDAVVIATGARFRRTGLSGLVPEAIPGWDLEGMAVTPEKLLDAQVELGSSVVVLDGDGHVTAPGLAEKLAGQGRRVTLVTPYALVGPKLVEEMNLPHAIAPLIELDVEMVPNTWVKEIRPGEVDLFNVYAPERERRVCADHVVMVAGRESDEELYLSLRGRVRELHRVGDCVAPGDIGTAMLDAARLGRSL